MSFTIHHVSVIDSTQDEAFRRLEAGETLKTVIIADIQTKGRGRQGRVWDSVKGNLFTSFIWPLPRPEDSSVYSLLVAVALCHTISGFLKDPEKLRIKWPNDLMLDGVKCAGILLDRPRPDILIIGIGVNITNAPADRAKLVDFSEKTPTPRHFLEVYLENLSALDSEYRSKGVGPIRAEWLKHAYGIGENMIIRLPNETFPARFEGLAEDGACLARLADGTIRSIHTGEVFF